MDLELRKRLFAEQLELAHAAGRVLAESRERAGLALEAAAAGAILTVAQRESCEALTARFARLCDILVQRLFRTVDQIELVDEGSILDRLERTEKRGIIASAAEWRELRELRNEIAHDYLIESSDRVVAEALRCAPTLLAAVEQLDAYARARGYCG